MIRTKELREAEANLFKPLEGDIQKAIVQTLELLGHAVYRNNTGAVRKGSRYFEYGLRRNKKVGGPDLVVISTPGGRFVGVEVKKPGEKPTKEQYEWGAECEAHGGVWGWVTDVKGAVELVNSAKGVGNASQNRKK